MHTDECMSLSHFPISFKLVKENKSNSKGLAECIVNCLHAPTLTSQVVNGKPGFRV